MSMKKRFANIVAKFRLEGLGEAKKGLTDVGSSAKGTGKALNGIDGRRSLREIVSGSLVAQRGLRTLRTASDLTARSIGGIGRAGTRMGLLLAATLRRSTTLMKGLAVGMAGIAASQGLSAGAAARFALSSAQTQVERLRTLRESGSGNVRETEFWEKYGSRAGLASGDASGILKQFMAARKESDPESEIAKAFASLNGSSGGGTLGIDGLLPKSKSLFGGIEAHANLATAAIGATNLSFTQFLQKVNQLDRAKRDGVLKDIFGDEASKVAAMADAVGRVGMRAGDVITPAQLAQVQRFEAASRELSGTWESFRRQVFSAVEPLLTRYAFFFDFLIRRFGPRAIQTFFVRPLNSAHQMVLRFLGAFDRANRSTGGFAAIRQQIANTITVLKLATSVAFELAHLLVTGFLPKPGTIETTYVAILRSIQNGLLGIRDWIRTDGPAFVAWVRMAAEVLGRLAVAAGAVMTGIAKGIDEALLARGIDWKEVLSPESLVEAGRKTVAFFAALFRDVSRVFGGQTGFLETGLVRWLVDAFETVREKVGDVVLSVRKSFEKALASVRARVESLVAYVRTAFAEFQSAMSGGMALGDMTTTLGQMLSIVGHVVDYLVRLGTAIRQVVQEGGRAPEGFKWLETVYGIAERLGGAIANIFEALKKITQPLDDILKRFSLWDTATIALAGLIVSKIAFAFGTTVVGAIGAAISAAKTLMGILGFGAGGGAAAGAATAGATGGILAGITAIGASLGQVLLRFTPIVGALAGITAGFYAILQQVDRLMPFIDRLGGALGLKTKADVELDVSRVRERMNSDYARYGGKTGVSPVAAPSDGVLRQYDVMPTTAEWNRVVARNGWDSERPTNVVNLTIGDHPPIQVSATDSQAAELQRMRARRLG